MKHFDSIIHHMEAIQLNIANDQYSSGHELASAFEEIHEWIGLSTNDATHTDLEDILRIQEYLINRVCQIHDEEISPVNESLFQKSHHIKEILHELQDGKRAFHLYTLSDKEYEYFLVGDLHSDTRSLHRVLQRSDFFQSVLSKKKVRLLFLGDYVDRGKAHLKILEYILLLKLLFPNQIFLLKGNHDDGVFSDDNVKLCVKKPEDENDEDYFLLYLDAILKPYPALREPIINAYLRFFQSLCNGAFVANDQTVLFAVHGGIPRPEKDTPNLYGYLPRISALTDGTILDVLNNPITSNLSWSDPTEGGEDLRESFRRFRFTEEDFNAFQKHMGFDLMIRGHEAEENGYKPFFNNRLFTLFSSGVHSAPPKVKNPETAYPEIAPKIARFLRNGQIEFLDL